MIEHMTTPTQAQVMLVANAIAYELNLGHADIRPHIERAAERAIAIIKQTTADDIIAAIRALQDSHDYTQPAANKS